MKNLILPKDELLKKILDHQYKEEELRYDHPKLRSNFFRENPISTEEFQQQVYDFFISLLEYFISLCYHRNRPCSTAAATTILSYKSLRSVIRLQHRTVLFTCRLPGWAITM